jgi:Ca2+-binding EF-hand superfamily protein
LFVELDGDHDGTLTYTELWRDPGLNIDVLSLFFAFDRDLDGELSFSELQLNASTGATETQMRQSLEACDDDRDGKLSLREYQLAPAGIGYITLEVFGRGDRDNDGYLGWNEFYGEQSPLLIGLAWELFGRYDRDHDGRLGMDELQFTVDPKRVPLPALFRMKDRDHDGRLQFGELFSAAKPAAGNPFELERYQVRLARAQEQFQRDDADGDGSLDLHEFTRGRKADAEREREEYTTRLFIADSDGSNMKQLTNLPEFQFQGSPAWSSDGKYIAFDGLKNGSQVIVVQADGRNPRVLGPGAMPSFSPDGQRIAFSKPDAGIWIMSSQGPDEELLQLDPQGWGSDWSPDGKIVYALTTEGGGNLAVFDFVAGSVVLLFDRQKSRYRQIQRNMAWSPDGKRIVFKGLTTDGKVEIGIVDARGAKFGHVQRFVGDHAPGFAWNLEKNRILFVKHDPEVKRFQIFFVEPDALTEPQALPGQDEFRNYSDIAFSPDGKRIVFSCHKRIPQD